MTTGLLLSGGMDSIALAWWKRPQWAVTIDYGQRAATGEIQAAREICNVLGIEHDILAVDCSSLGSGDMAHAAASSHAKATDWWPYRNQLLVTLACMRAVSRGVTALYIGTVKSDGEFHRDGSPEFIRLLDQLVAFQEGALRIEAPALEYTTSELVRTAATPPGLLAWAHSCHKANIACGDCRGCSKYFSTLAELGPEYACVC